MFKKKYLSTSIAMATLLSVSAYGQVLAPEEVEHEPVENVTGEEEVL